MAEITAGITPSRTSVKAKVAAVEQTAMSAAAMRPSPPARAGAADPGDHRLRALPDRGQHLAHPAGRHVPAGERGGGLLQIGAGAEDRPGVAQHDHPDRVVGDRGREGRRPGPRSEPDESALRLCGLSRVSVATPAATSVRTKASAMAGYRTLHWHASRGRLVDMPSTLPDG